MGVQFEMDFLFYVTSIMTPLPTQALLDKIKNLPSSPLSLYEERPVETTVLFNLKGEAVCGWCRKAGVAAIKEVSDLDSVPSELSALIIQRALVMIECSKDVSGEAPSLIKVNFHSKKMVVVVNKEIVTLFIIGKE